MSRRMKMIFPNDEVVGSHLRRQAAIHNPQDTCFTAWKASIALTLFSLNLWLHNHFDVFAAKPFHRASWASFLAGVVNPWMSSCSNSPLRSCHNDIVSHVVTLPQRRMCDFALQEVFVRSNEGRS